MFLCRGLWCSLHSKSILSTPSLCQSSKLWAPYWFDSLELRATHQYLVDSVETQPSQGEHAGVLTV